MTALSLLLTGYGVGIFCGLVAYMIRKGVKQ